MEELVLSLVVAILRFVGVKAVAGDGKEEVAEDGDGDGDDVSSAGKTAEIREFDGDQQTTTSCLTPEVTLHPRTSTDEFFGKKLCARSLNRLHDYTPAVTKVKVFFFKK
ncbi:unnamed protein product [Gongylonema pulchrum]|uniref:Secreted protein n=1 Tax=Gongylonema pulchrum TaxID=637853 RepID=A0A183DKE8_9BILA|nr:unnamed protein product [Gongylonema pulchrum]